MGESSRSVVWVRDFSDLNDEIGCSGADVGTEEGHASMGVYDTQKTLYNMEDGTQGGLDNMGYRSTNDEQRDDKT